MALTSDVDRQFATTLDRGLKVLRAFGPTESQLTNKEIAERTGLPKPTVSRLTYTLMTLGYLRYLPNAGKYGKYGLGTATLSLGYPLLGNLHIRQVARRPMQDLANQARGWVSMGLRDRLNMVCIETARSRSVLKMSRADIGQSFPIPSTAMGRGYLAGLTRADRLAITNQIRVKDPHLWRQEAANVDRCLEQYAERGFCHGRGVQKPAMEAVAVPMRFPIDDFLIVFNCAVHADVVSPAQVQEELGPNLVAMVRSIEDLLTRG